jgi:nucleotide-binding universal stress UspA family protein
MFEDLLVLLDGQASSELIVGWVRRLCRTSGARIRLLVVRNVEGTVWDGLRPVAFAAQLEDSVRLEGLAYLEGVAGPLENAGFRVSAEVRFGPPVDAVLDAVREAGESLVALAETGSPGGRGAMDRLAHELIHRAPMAVLVARARDQRAA